MPAAPLLVVLGLAFAWSMGAHYTGACMGMPYAMGALSRRAALGLMAVFVLLGAALFSHATLQSIGHGLVIGALPPAAALAATAVAFALTTLFTRLRLPTSTIQIFVFAVAGVALARGQAVAWAHIAALVLLWVAAPPLAALLGFAATRLLDVLAPHLAPHLVPGLDAARAGRLVLAAGGIAASLAMGANDVANATALFLASGVASLWSAALLGGLGLAAGVLSWGRPLLERVAHGIARLDLRMAIAAKFTQAAIVLAAVAFGAFTSMNQALVGAMAGASLARGGDRLDRAVLRAILRGWAIGPAAGLGLGYAAARLLALAGA